MPPAHSGRKLSDARDRAAPPLDRAGREVAEALVVHSAAAAGAARRCKNATGRATPIDRFVLARLEREGLAPSPEADRDDADPPRHARPDRPAADARRGRRLPRRHARPTPTRRSSIGCWPRRATASAWPIRWLDAARYADTNGYQTDGERIMWRWRDWVIDAFNRNMPFDQFTIEQLAGDLLPERDARAEDRHRLQPQPSRQRRGRHHPRRVRRRVRRRPRRDHGHRLAGPDAGLRPLPRPQVRSAHAEGVLPALRLLQQRAGDGQGDQVRQLAAVDPGADARSSRQQLADARAQAGRGARDASTGCSRSSPRRSATGRRRSRRSRSRLVDRRRLVAHFPLDGARRPASAGQGRRGSSRTASRLSPRAASARPRDFDGKRFLDAGDVGDFGFYDKFTLAAWIYPDGDRRRHDRLAHDGRPPGRRATACTWTTARCRSTSSSAGSTTRSASRPSEPLAPDRWHHVLATYDGSRVAAGVKRLRRRPAEPSCKVLLDELNQPFNVKEPLRIGAGGGPESRFHGLIDDVRVYDARSAAEEVGRGRHGRRRSTTSPRSRRRKRTAAQADKLRAYFLETARARGNPRGLAASCVALRERARQLRRELPDVMVMEEMPHAARHASC